MTGTPQTYETIVLAPVAGTNVVSDGKYRKVFAAVGQGVAPAVGQTAATLSGINLRSKLTQLNTRKKKFLR